MSKALRTFQLVHTLKEGDQFYRAQGSKKHIVELKWANGSIRTTEGLVFGAHTEIETDPRDYGCELLSPGQVPSWMLPAQVGYDGAQGWPTVDDEPAHKVDVYRLAGAES